MSESKVEGQDQAAVPDNGGGARRYAARLSALRMPALRLHPARDGIPWGDWLFWLFRAIAVFELGKALLHWAFLLGAGHAAFADMPAAFRIATVYFAVLDPVAAVGMWMTASWGAVLWLLAAVSQIALCLFFPAAFGPLWPLVAVEALAIAAYVGFTLQVASRDEA